MFKRKIWVLAAAMAAFTATGGTARMNAADPPPAGPGKPGLPTGTNTANQQALASAATTDTSSDVLKASNAREIATVSCTSAKDDQCFSANAKTAIGDIKKNFNGTLLGNDGKDTSALATAVKSFLSESKLWPDGVNWAVVHLARYDASGNGTVHDRWLLAQRKGANATELTDGLHIQGVKRIAVVFLHLDATLAVDPAKSEKQQVLDSFSNVSYRAIVAKKQPINLQNLLSLLRLAVNNVEAASVDRNFDMAGGGVIEKVDVPSDVTVFGVELKGNPTLVGQSQKYDNEGKYWWDASVAVPVNKLSLLDYSSTSGVYTPTTINKQSLYAVINIYPDLVDLKYGDKRWLMPRAVAGIGVTGRPGENFMVGGAWGIKQLQFFVGSAFANHNVAPTGSATATAANITQRYSSHLTFGINVPVLDAIKKLGSASSSSAKAGTAATATK